MRKLKNWDNKTWLSSKSYISKFNKFLKRKSNLNKNSKILDIGCGRANIISALQQKYKFKNKPTGIDIVANKDVKRNIVFKKIEALKYLKKQKKYDLILIKQTIHLLKIDGVKALLKETKKNLKPQGKILIFSLHPHKNELPCFYLMKKKLRISFKRDLKIQKIIFNLYPKLDLKYFSFKVKISKKKYIEMISKKFISILLSLNNKQILTGINEIDLKYKKNLKFYDKLVCIIIKNN